VPGSPSSLRARLTLWYTALLGIPLVGFAVACYFIFAGILFRRTDRFIQNALSAISTELSAERRTGLDPADAMRTTLEEVQFRDLTVAILDSSGHVVVTSPASNPRARAAMVEAIRGRAPGRSLAASIGSGETAYRVIVRPVMLGRVALSLAGADPLSDIADILRNIQVMFLVAIPLLVGVASTGGYVLARGSLEPVTAMAREAANITAHNLDRRVSVSGSAELAELARVINELLDRLEQAFVQQRRFVADASHELRTPAAILRTEADVTLARPERSESEYRASVSVIRDASRRLSRIVDELFLLARADAGHLVTHREPVYLEDLVAEAVRSVEGVAEQRRVRLEVGDLVEAPATGDPDLLGRVLLNLLDNAIKYSPEGGTVLVAMRRSGGEGEISVVDSGPGIPPEAHAQIFERFFRLDTARSRGDRTATSGAGLGLAIARRIAELHAGRVELVSSRPGRTEFRLTVPLDPAVST
jgi:heavy metal sensor kinase